VYLLHRRCHHDLVSEGPRPRYSQDAVTRREPGDVCPDLGHDAGTLATGYERGLQTQLIVAAGDENIGKIQGCSVIGDADLLGATRLAR
jgi:hypothetical protein